MTETKYKLTETIFKILFMHHQDTLQEMVCATIEFTDEVTNFQIHDGKIFFQNTRHPIDSTLVVIINKQLFVNVKLNEDTGELTIATIS